MAAPKLNYRDEIATEIIARIEAGTAPWQKPWKAGAIGAAPFNPTSGKPYRGINDMWLTLQGHTDPRWLTYNQAAAAGAQVRKGEKSTTVEYWQWSASMPLVDSNGQPVLDADGKPRTQETRLDRPRVFYAKVFNAGQIDGLEAWVPPAPSFDPVERAEALMAGAGVPVFHRQHDQAFYNPATDEIHLPPMAAFHNAPAYYGTALHELGHATGHPTRLARSAGPFGSESYAREELRAEISSYMLARDLGIPFDPSDHAAYVESWLKALREDRNEIFHAAKDAEIIKTWVMEPERRPELERAARQHVTAQTRTGIEAREASVRQAVAPERPAAQVDIILSVEEYEAKIDAAMRDIPNRPGRMAPLYQMSQAYQGDTDYPPNLAHAWHADKVPAKDADTLLARFVIAANWPVKAAEAMGFADSLQDMAMITRELPSLDWEYEYSDDASFRERTGALVSKIFTAAAEMVAKSPRHAELLSVVWDKLGHGAPEFDGFVPAGERKDALMVKLAGDPVAATLAAHGLPGEFVRKTQVEEQAMVTTPHTLTYLAVPFAEKDAAKNLGAKWAKGAKSWYIPEGADPALFARWTVKNAAQDPALSPQQEFAAFLKSNGLKLDGDPEMDGKWHRVPTEDDKGKEKRGSYRGFLDGRPAGQAINGWNGNTVQWVSTGTALTGEERARIQAEAAQVRADRDAERTAAAEKAARTAYGVWQNLPDAVTENSPYLARKGVGAHGVKIDGAGKLVVPARDGDGKLWTVQFIGEDGKRWLKDSQKAGTMHVIEPSGAGTLDSLGRTGGTVVIAEGYATGSRIYEAVHRPVVVAFDCGNLKAVAEAVQAKYPGRPILIAADNDHARVNAQGVPENIGIIKAEEAAKAVGGFFIAPKFTAEEMAKGLTDFDDLGKARGNGAVRGAIEPALARIHQPERSIA